MIRSLMIAAALIAAPMVGAAQPVPPDGAYLFHHKCGVCHEPGGMGTGLLARRVQPAELEKRSGLNPDYVFQYARRGLGNMPPIPPGQASDDELKAIGAYLASGPHGGK